jgi:5'-nucleotidase
MQISHARSGARILGLALAALAALAIAVPTAQAAKPSKPSKDVPVQLLGINDFHGNLEPPTGSGGLITPAPGEAAVPAGGAGFLANQLRALRQQNPNTLTVSAGDLIGASPLLSALFHDEPTIEAMNEMGLNLNAVGNHEFDEGVTELLRMQNGGCGADNSCPNGTFGGADFQFLAANVVYRDTGEPIFQPYAIKKFGNIKVGFIGMTLEGTPDIVSASGIQDVTFLDEAETANKYAAELRNEHGVRAIVVLLHEGGTPSPFAGIDACNVAGPITDIVDRTSDAVDLFVTGHTHQPYVCSAANSSLIDGRPVTSASSFGRLVTNIGFTLDHKTKDIKDVTADNTIVTRTGTPAADIQQLIAGYNTLAAPIANQRVGRISANIPRETTPIPPGPLGLNPLGYLIADAQLADTDDADRGDADIALMNPGGVRADLTFASSAAGEGDGVVTYGEAFSVQPFNNIVVTNTFTGAQLLDVLKDQWCSGPRTVLLPSANLTYTYDQSDAATITGVTCSPTVPSPVSDVRINGVPLDPAATYRVTTNNFLADGGDSFASLRAGTNRTSLSDFDIDSLVRYLEPTLAGPPIGPPPTNRITIVP